MFVRSDVVDAPDHAVLSEIGGAVDREVKRDAGRERPVEESDGEAVVLGERQPLQIESPGTWFARANLRKFRRR